MSQESDVAASLIRGPFIGTMIALILYGITCIQAFFYFQTYTRDHKALKSTVALVLVLETVHAALSISLLDYYLVKNYGQVQALQTATWIGTTMYTVGLLIDLVIYLYFTWRIWICGHRSITNFVFDPTWYYYLAQSQDLLYAGNALFIVGDILSASVMAYYLHKTRVGLRRTDLLVNRLLVFIVATGAIIVIVDVVALILTAVQRDTLAFLAAVIVQTRLVLFSSSADEATYKDRLNVRNSHLRAFHDAGKRETSSLALPASAFTLRFADPSDLSGVTAHHSGASNSGKSGESWHTARDIETSSQPNLDGAV
ncbi:hypothetical protein ID866_4463 [Astraeus odoratus]|nr:hypothetical protein ID866_4463 [Astraeus odoratus]